MSGFRALLSVLLLYHFAAVALVALPSRVPEPVPVEGRVEETGMVSVVKPRLDTIAPIAANAERRLLTLLAPLNALTSWYQAAGIRQNWDMFTAPKTAEQYLRINYVISGPTRERLFLVRELVLPAQPDDRFRFAHDFRDKALTNAIDAFFVRRSASGGRESADAARNDFAPVVRYFRNQYRERFLAETESIVRTEVWYGLAEMAPSGRSLPPELRSARLDALRRYEDRARSAADILSAPSVMSEEREADITWTLEYVE